MNEQVEERGKWKVNERIGNFSLVVRIVSSLDFFSFLAQSMKLSEDTLHFSSYFNPSLWWGCLGLFGVCGFFYILCFLNLKCFSAAEWPSDF